ncbi:MAG: Hint domain-containing protein [Chloroflexales bacterium]|nr:Hint domain-containing protein [Chloroflexales bacterium]
MRYTDSTGHCIDTLVDVACIADDIDAIAANGYTAEKGAALAATVKTTKQTTKHTPTHAPCKNSFSAATPVATPDSAVPISAIKVGDTVLAYHMAW